MRGAAAAVAAAYARDEASELVVCVGERSTRRLQRIERRKYLCFVDFGDTERIWQRMADAKVRAANPKSKRLNVGRKSCPRRVDANARSRKLKSVDDISTIKIGKKRIFGARKSLEIAACWRRRNGNNLQTCAHRM